MTNWMMGIKNINESEEYKGFNSMFTNEDQINVVARELGISDMNDENSLRNLRNFVVLYYGVLTEGEMTDEKYILWNVMQSVTAVIDEKIWEVCVRL